MYVTPDQIQTANKASVEAFLAVANAQFSALEKLANISAGAFKGAFEDSIANTRALLGAKDMQEFVALQNAFAQPAMEKAIAYSKSVYEVSRRSSRMFQTLALCASSACTATCTCSRSAGGTARTGRSS